MYINLDYRLCGVYFFFIIIIIFTLVGGEVKYRSKSYQKRHRNIVRDKDPFQFQTFPLISSSKFLIGSGILMTSLQSNLTRLKPK